MQCQCGAEAVYREHEVKTLEKAQEWYPNIRESELPVIIKRHECVMCKRQLLRGYK